ncbi:MAG: RNA methyltransferase [Rhizobiaceae bacterium]|nr:RNA methyltransferase [Rhizobiaceae bacterium]
MAEENHPGQVKEITAVSNPVIKSIRALNLKKNRDADQLFIAEGLKLITDAVQIGWNIKTLIYAKNIRATPHLQEVAAIARARGASILEVSEKVLGAITRRDNPQMVVAVVKQRWEPLRDIKVQGDDVWVALDRVRDPGNLGTIIRTVDAVGAKGVILIGETTDPFSIEAVRATMGSIFNIKTSRASLAEFKKFQSEWPGIVVATHLKGAVDYRSLNYADQPTLLLMGNEQQGLPDELAENCSNLALIPMDGKADSLNLAIATGIMLFEIRRDKLKVSGTDE